MDGKNKRKEVMGFLQKSEQWLPGERGAPTTFDPIAMTATKLENAALFHGGADVLDMRLRSDYLNP